MNDIHNNENISQEEEFVSPGQEKVNGKATPEQSGPSTGEPRIRLAGRSACDGLCPGDRRSKV